MLTQPRPRLLPTDRLTPRSRARRRLLRPMLAGSLLLHLALLAFLILERPEPPPPESPDAADTISVVMESPPAKQASTASANPAQQQTAAGNQNAAVAPQPSKDTATAAPPPPPAPVAKPTPEPAPPSPIQETSVEPYVPPEAPPAPPVPQPPKPVPPQPAPPQPAPQRPVPPQAQTAPPEVSLSQQEEPALPPPPPFVPPQPPPPLPTAPPPRAPAQPRYASRSPSGGFPQPQPWSLNMQPQTTGHANHGLDLSTAPTGGSQDSMVSYVAGARPTADWMSALKKWTQARVYYPEEAAREGQEGMSTIDITIDRSGKVLNTVLVQSARSAFLDGAWLDVFRRAVVPAFTANMTEPTTTVRFTLHYRLIRR